MAICHEWIIWNRDEKSNPPYIITMKEKGISLTKTLMKQIEEGRKT
jgi:hypothetical protein